MMHVLDNTVLIDFWAGEDENQRKARVLIEAVSLWMAPGLWCYEFGNVMRKLMRLGLVSEELKNEAWIGTLGFLETEHELDFYAVDQIAAQSGLKFYDASYVWLARSLGCKLYTRDDQILRRCPDVACGMPEE